MSEKNTYKTLKDKMAMPGDRIDRIENFLTPGTPDVNFCAEGVECWIEIKCPLEPTDPHKALFKGNHDVSILQKNWMIRQLKAKGRAFFLIVTNRHWILISGMFADSINEMTVDQILDNSMWSCSKPIRDKFQWIYLRQILIGGKNDR